jgi:hypothetical protein
MDVSGNKIGEEWSVISKQWIGERKRRTVDGGQYILF